MVYRWLQEIKAIWIFAGNVMLKISTSNKMQEILAKYYLDAVKQHGMLVHVDE